MINNLLKIFNKLRNESSRTGKELILKDNKDNEIFKEVLKFVFNPYIVTGISSKKLNKEVKPVESANIPFHILELTRYLTARDSGRDIDIYIVQQFINEAETVEEKELIEQIVTKSLKVGITAKTINKIYGAGFIPEFSVMLAESYDKKHDRVDGKFYITLKLDGNRCVAIKENGITKFFTRKGQEIEGMIQLQNEFESYPDNNVFDGELLLANDKDLPSDELFRETQKVVRKKGEKTNLQFHMFDTLPLLEFKSGKSKKSYEQRRNTINTFSDSEYIKILPTLYEGDNKSVIFEIMNWVEANGYEGLMVNRANGLYQSKRTTDLLKVKKMKSADLICIGLEEGSGRNQGRLGAILVEYKGGVTKVGSGFTDEEREYFWNNQDEISGRIAEIKYFNESMDDKTKQASLRFPIFKTVRLDKGVDDVRYE